MGVKNVKKLVEVHRHEKRPVIFISNFDVYVDLPGSLKGANLSRNFEVIDEVLQQAIDGDVNEIEKLCSVVARKLLDRHEYADRTEVSAYVCARLRADPSLLGGAVEELLRHVSPVNHATFRFAAEPVEIGGVRIGAGEVVVISLSGANRDPSRFADPDRLDLVRDNSGHVAFGHGIHYCLGAPLARLEAEIAFRGLLSRFGSMALAVPQDELRWRPSTLIHGLEALPVRLDPTTS